MSGPISSDVESLYRNAVRGTERGHSLAGLSSDGGSAEASRWLSALRLWMQVTEHPKRVALGEADKALPWCSPSCSYAQWAMVGLRAYFAMKSHALQALYRWVEDEAPATPLREAHLLRLASWHALVEGASMASVDRLVRAIQVATKARDADLVLDLSTVAVYECLRQGEDEEGLKRARRAWRMASAEGLALREYLAGIALARVRRSLGRPHLAVRILRALKDVAPASLHSWLLPEAVLAGALWDPTAPFESTVRELFEAASRGEAARFGSAMPPGQHPHDRVLASIRDALDPTSEPQEEWSSGRMHFGFEGLQQVLDPSESAPAYVVGGPGMTGKRVLRAGLGLCRPTHRVEHTGRKNARVGALLCALALAPEGLTLEAVFHLVYGFAYAPDLHDATLRVLLHRTRARSGEFANIDRVEDRLVLRPLDSFAVADPRCAEALDERVLRILAARKAPYSVSALAAAAQVSPRMMRNVLRRLGEHGVTADPSGKEVRYALEDTTFEELSSC